jgi:hypothetical protein
MAPVRRQLQPFAAGRAASTMPGLLKQMAAEKLVAGARNGGAHLVLLTKLGVVFHDLAHQALDHLLPAGFFHAAGHLGHDLGQRGDNLVAVDRGGLVFRDRIFGIEIIDRLDQQAMQTGPFVVVFEVVANGGSPRQAVAFAII